MGKPADGVVRSIVRVCADLDHDARSLRIALLDEIGRAVPFDAYAWLITDPETEVGSDPLADVPSLAELPKLIRLKYLTTQNRWTSLGGGAALLSTATDGDLARSRLWRELLSEHEVSDVASTVFRDGLGCWGFLDLWRCDGLTFDGPVIDLMEAVVPDITTALRRVQAATFRSDPGGAPAGPGVVLLSSRLEPAVSTSGAEDLLARLLPPAAGQPAVPAVVYNVAAQLLAVEAGVDDHPPLARVHLGAGRWVVVRAAPMLASDAVETGQIAVTLESAGPEHRLPVFALAHGLTPRETDVLGALITGADTRAATVALHITRHTLQDHLKSIFAKTGAQSRKAVIARAVGA